MNLVVTWTFHKQYQIQVPDNATPEDIRFTAEANYPDTVPEFIEMQAMDLGGNEVYRERHDNMP